MSKTHRIRPVNCEKDPVSQADMNSRFLYAPPLRSVTAALTLTFTLVLGACSSGVTPVNAPTAPDDGNNEPVAPNPPVTNPDALFPSSASDIFETESVYQDDGYAQVNVLRIDVRTVTEPGSCVPGDYDGCTLQDVQEDTNRQDDSTPRINVHFRADDYADDGSVINAELRQRGGTTRQAPQKSFRVRLEERDNLWRGERSVFLNKHPFEGTRMRNKVAFDLMAGIPHLLSARTQFANLWIDDGLGPVDYGLFTHVEAPGGNYLEKRGRSRDDRLYKINLFNFNLSDMGNLQVDEQGEPLDKDLFETTMDIESGDDHRPLARMLRDFHDPLRSFDSILDQYFNRNNVLTWMAVNFLMNQSDAISQNFLLYNPVGTERFYFLPWDYDGALTPEAEPAQSTNNDDLQRRLFAGYARGSKSDFYARYYRLPGMHEKMLAAATYLRQNWLTDERINSRVQQASQVIAPFLSRAPDNEFTGDSNVVAAAAEFPNHIADNLEALRTRFSYPIPPELLQPVQEQDSWLFQWRPGFDPTGNQLTYELQISNGLEFTPDQIVQRVENIDSSAMQPSFTGQIPDITDTFGIIQQRIDNSVLRSGEFFARVIVRPGLEPERFWQISENTLFRNGINWQGPVSFINP